MASLIELLQQKKQALAANKREKTVKPPEKTSRWRILPSWRGEGEAFYHDFGQHYIKDASGELKAVYVCTDKTFGKPCSICDNINAAIRNSNDDGMVEMLKEMKASGRILMNAVQVDGENPTTPVILEVGPTLFEGILNGILEWGEGVIDIQNGMDFVIERSGKGINTKYSVTVGKSSKSLPADIMKKVKNLDEYVAQESAEQQAKALANLKSIAGYLPAAGAGVAAARMTSGLAEVGLDDGDFDETLTIPGEPLAEPAAAVAAAAEEPAQSTGDSELDDLLADLG